MIDAGIEAPGEVRFASPEADSRPAFIAELIMHRLALLFAAATAPLPVLADAIFRNDFERRQPAEIVADAAEQSRILRIAIAEYRASNGQWPASLATVGFADPTPTGPAAASLTQNRLLLTFGDELPGETLAYAAWDQAGAPRWQCGRAPPPVDATLLSGAAASTSLADDALPDACRTTPSAETLTSELWTASANARLSISEHALAYGMFPASFANAGLPDPFPAARARIRLENGTLFATFAEPQLGETLAMSAWSQAGSIYWVCAYAPAPVEATALSPISPTDRTSFAESVLPHACRSNRPLQWQVSDALAAWIHARLAVSESYLANVEMPDSLTEAGVAEPYAIGLVRMQLNDGLLVASFSGALAGQTLGFAPYLQNEVVHWTCGHAPPPAGATLLVAAGRASQATTVDSALLPPNCL